MIFHQWSKWEDIGESTVEYKRILIQGRVRDDGLKEFRWTAMTPRYASPIIHNIPTIVAIGAEDAKCND